jgi:hypothetical protein
MAEVANFAFVDGDTGDEGYAQVRVEGNHVGLTLSLRNNGDVEAFLDAQALDPLIEALRTARTMIAVSE